MIHRHSFATRRCFRRHAAGNAWRSPTTFRPPSTVSGEAQRLRRRRISHRSTPALPPDAKTAKEASDANNAAMGKVLLALKTAGIAEKDYQTSRLSLQPQYGQNKSTGASPVVGLPRQQPRHRARSRDVTKVAERDRHAGRRRRQRHRQHQSSRVTQASKLLDDALVSRRSRMPAARRRFTPGRPASRWARRSAFPKGGALRCRCSRGSRWRAPMAASRAGGAGRGNAVGDGERELGDQAEEQ